MKGRYSQVRNDPNRRYKRSDVEFYGPNPLCGIYYLAALRAGEEMARAAGETDASAEHRRLFESGKNRFDSRAFNGEYYRFSAANPIGQPRVVRGRGAPRVARAGLPAFRPMASESHFNQRARGGARSGWPIGR